MEDFRQGEGGISELWEGDSLQHASGRRGRNDSTRPPVRFPPHSQTPPILLLVTFLNFWVDTFFQVQFRVACNCFPIQSLYNLSTFRCNQPVTNFMQKFNFAQLSKVPVAQILRLPELARSLEEDMQNENLSKNSRNKWVGGSPKCQIPIEFLVKLIVNNRKEMKLE